MAQPIAPAVMDAEQLYQLDEAVMEALGSLDLSERRPLELLLQVLFENDVVKSHLAEDVDPHGQLVLSLMRLHRAERIAYVAIAAVVRLVY